VENITLEVEANTPLFIAGADQAHIEGEGLRPPTVRGLMRWWFRAIMGGIVDVKTLQEKENEIFGTTSARSKIRILTSTLDKPVRIDQIFALNKLRYLWFSIQMQRARGQRISCYPPGSKFSITLLSDNSDILGIAACTLWSTIYLGGVGARMRRGAGSFRVLKAEGAIKYCNFSFKGTSINDLTNFLENNIGRILDTFKSYYCIPLKKPSVQPGFCVLSRKTSEIALISNLFSAYDIGLTEVSNIYQQFRSGRNKFGQRITGGIPRQDRVVLGLPIQRIYERDRFASPLHIGVMKVGTGYAIRLAKFYTSIHPHFTAKAPLLKKHLDSFDVQLKKRFSVIPIQIPEVT
jgi:CRISPR-associated protein Cmr1